jgi:hypothetical protein
MPTTVPNRPMNGAADAPTEASEPSLALQHFHLARQRHVHRPVDAASAGSSATWRRARTTFFHSRMAATKSAPMPVAFRSASERYNSSSDWPDQNTCPRNWSKAGGACLPIEIQRLVRSITGPGPDRGGKQAEHDQLDDEASLDEERPERYVAGCCKSNLFHSINPRIQTPGFITGRPRRHFYRETRSERLPPNHFQSLLAVKFGQRMAHAIRAILMISVINYYG